MIEKKPAAPKPRSRAGLPNYIFGSAKAAVTNPHTKKRKSAPLPTSLDDLPSTVKATPSSGCVFCDLLLAPNQSGMHSSKGGSVVCTRVR